MYLSPGSSWISAAFQRQTETNTHHKERLSRFIVLAAATLVGSENLPDPRRERFAVALYPIGFSTARSLGGLLGVVSYV